MTDLPPTTAAARARLFSALTELRQAAGNPSYGTLEREAATRRPPVSIRPQRLSDWFGGKTVPADAAAVRFLVEYLESRAARSGSSCQQRPLSWWLKLHEEAVQQRQASPGIRRRAADPTPSPRKAGRPINECDPIVLEVHRAIHIPGTSPADPLPGYVPRAHDARLREIADQVMAGGSSRLVTLVGGSSTGKTRACWELARYVDGRDPGRWRVWHPYDPTRLEAVLADLERVGPDTIVWLNEAQHYLMLVDTRLGERIAAGLRTLLQDPRRQPVLVLATVWSEYWDTLTTRPAVGEPDPYPQARDLLADTAVTITDAFTSDELATLAAPGVDPRVRYAVEHADSGRITQYLAGAPELETRYRTAGPAAQAIVQAAMDARRLGHPLALPHALLKRAAPGYLDDHDWDALAKDWLEQALGYTDRSCKGARGPVTRIRNRPGGVVTDGGQPCYRLADYLEQTGRIERAGVSPPDSFWHAVATVVTDPRLLRHLAKEAETLGNHDHAVELLHQAANRKDFFAMMSLARHRMLAGDAAGAESLFKQAAVYAVADLRQHLGDDQTAEAMRQYAADHFAGAPSSAASSTSDSQDPTDQQA